MYAYSMYVCMHIVCMHIVCIYACMYVCMYVCRTYVCMYKCNMYVCMYVCMYVFMYKCSMYVFMYTLFSVGSLVALAHRHDMHVVALALQIQAEMTLMELDQSLHNLEHESGLQRAITLPSSSFPTSQ